MSGFLHGIFEGLRGGKSRERFRSSSAVLLLNACTIRFEFPLPLFWPGPFEGHFIQVQVTLFAHSAPGAIGANAPLESSLAARVFEAVFHPASFDLTLTGHTS